MRTNIINMQMIYKYINIHGRNDRRLLLKGPQPGLFFLFVCRVDRSVIPPMKHGRSNSRAVDVENPTRPTELQLQLSFLLFKAYTAHQTARITFFFFFSPPMAVV